MKKLSLVRVLQWTAVGAGFVVIGTLNFNCGGQQFKTAGLEEQSSQASAAITPGVFDKPESPYAQMTAEQQYQSMLNVTGQAGAPTGAMTTEYNLRQGALADNDSLAMVSAPLMMASTSLAGEVCNGLLTSEKAKIAAMRLFFKGVDFTKNVAQNNAQAFSESAEAMSQSLYGRGLSSEEQAILKAFYVEFVAGLVGQMPVQSAAAQTTALYLSLCSGMLAAYDSMTY